MGGIRPALVVSEAVYVAVLLLLRPLDAAEGAALLRMLPAGLRGITIVRWIVNT